MTEHEFLDVCLSVMKDKDCLLRHDTQFVYEGEYVIFHAHPNTVYKAIREGRGATSMVGGFVRVLPVEDRLPSMPYGCRHYMYAGRCYSVLNEKGIERVGLPVTSKPTIFYPLTSIFD